MPYPQFDRDRLLIKPLRERKNKTIIEQSYVRADAVPRPLTPETHAILEETVSRIKSARANGKPVILAFGAHTIKNGLGFLLSQLIEEGWVTHLATNGAGIIHDWEFAFQGASSEDVRAYVREGQFGIWQETGFFINLALLVGAYEGLGYGESIGAMIEKEAVTIPSADELKQVTLSQLDAAPDRAAAAADLLSAVQKFKLPADVIKIPHPFKKFSAQAAAFRACISFTGHPMIGHDIIYEHPLNHGGAVGRTALRDFLVFAQNVSRIDGGVYLSVGSAVMSPMIFEKSLAMAQNLALQQGRRIENHFIVVVDLAPSVWDWQKEGEPPADHPAYYLRYCKTFSRMGGTMRYASADNRDFLLTLYQALRR